MNFVNDLKLLVLNNCKDLGNMVNEHLKDIQRTNKNFIAGLEETRFSNGEGKIKILDTIRQKDVYILSDIGNHSCTYQMFGYENHMDPDSHFQDVKRVISAIKGHTTDITVILPLLYAARQHKRKGRESLDCAIALQELQNLGVKNIITFDVHDPNIQNAIPLLSFENFYPTNVVLNKFIETEKLNLDDLLVVSPDTGAMDRAKIYADILSSDVGMFYKRRDLSKIVNGKNPIIAHEYLGKDVKDKDIIVVDDMISSGQSMLEVAEQLKQRGASQIFFIASFALFDKGTEKFNEAFAKGLFTKVYSTNLSYIYDEVKQSPWFQEVDCSEYIAQVINIYNQRQSISGILNNREEIYQKIQAIRANRK